MVPFFQKYKNSNSGSQGRKLEKVIATISAEFGLFLIHIIKVVIFSKLND
jgi:hypothetical protein